MDTLEKVNEREFRDRRNNEVVSVGRWVTKTMSELRRTGEGNAAVACAVLSLIKGAAAMAARHADGSVDEADAHQILIDAITLVAKSQGDLGGAVAPAFMTGATLAFVQAAERVLVQEVSAPIGADAEPLSADERYKLVATVDRMRDGQEAAGSGDTVGGWLDRLRDHPP